MAGARHLPRRTRHDAFFGTRHGARLRIVAGLLARDVSGFRPVRRAFLAVFETTVGLGTRRRTLLPRPLLARALLSRLIPRSASSWPLRAQGDTRQQNAGQ